MWKTARLVDKVFKADSGSSRASLSFSFVLLTIIVWGATGPLFGYSDTWQLVINTGTSIVTFLNVYRFSSRKL